MDTVPASRWRALGFVALSVVCLSAAGGYVLQSKARHQALIQAGAALPAATVESVATVQAEPHVLFRNLSTAAEAGFLAVAPLSAPDGARQITDHPCSRVHMAAGHGLCLVEQQDGPFASPYRARVFGPDLRTTHELPLAGLPSRARVSPDGRLGASTVFVNGDSYATGTFSTRTSLYDMDTGISLGDLETFAAYKDGARFQSPDLNYWGVTFARRPGRFYATQTRNVDDQAEWLDDGTVLYSVESDIYAVAADGGGAPRLFTRRADSPAAVPVATAPELRPGGGPDGDGDPVRRR